MAIPEVSVAGTVTDDVPAYFTTALNDDEQISVRSSRAESTSKRGAGNRQPTKSHSSASAKKKKRPARSSSKKEKHPTTIDAASASSDHGRSVGSVTLPSQTKPTRRSKSSSSKQSLEHHLEKRRNAKKVGTTIATDPTAPLSPSESTSSLTNQAAEKSLLDSLSQKDTSPRPTSGEGTIRLHGESPAWRLCETLKLTDGSNTPASSYTKKALKNTDQNTLPKALGISASLSTGSIAPSNTRLTSRKLRIDTKLGKEESRLRQRSNSVDIELLETDAKLIDRDIEQELSAKAIPVQKLPRTARKSKSLDHSQQPPERPKKDEGSRRKFDAKYAPHNRPGVAHHKSSDGVNAFMLESSSNKIVDRIPHIVSWHSRKTKDASIDDDVSFASFDSSLTPSVATRDVDEDDEEGEGEDRVDSFALNRLSYQNKSVGIISGIDSAIPEPTEEYGSFNDEEEPPPIRVGVGEDPVLPPTKKSAIMPPLVNEEQPRGWRLREEARASRLNDASPAVPQRLKSVPDVRNDADAKSPSIVPQTMLSILQVDKSDITGRASNSKMEWIASRATKKMSSKKQRWTAKERVGLPPAFSSVADFSIPATTSKVIEKVHTHKSHRKARALSTFVPDLPNQSARSESEIAYEPKPIPLSPSKRKSSKVKDGTKKAEQAVATELLKHRISQMNEELRTKNSENDSVISSTGSERGRKSRSSSFCGDGDDDSPKASSSSPKRHKSADSSDKRRLKKETADEGDRKVKKSSKKEHLMKKESPQKDLMKKECPKKELMKNENPKKDKIRKQGCKRGLLKKDEDSEQYMVKIEDDGEALASELKSTKSLKKQSPDENTGGDETVLPSNIKRSKSPRKSTGGEPSGSSHSRSSEGSKRGGKSVDSRESSSSYVSSKSSKKIKDESSSHSHSTWSPRSKRLGSVRSHGRANTTDKINKKEQKARSRSQSPGCRGKRQPKSLVQPEKLAPWQIKQQLKHRVTPIGSLYSRRLDDDDDDEEDTNLPPAFRSSTTSKTKKSMKLNKMKREDKKQLKDEHKGRRSSVMDALGKFNKETSDIPPAFRQLNEEFNQSTAF